MAKLVRASSIDICAIEWLWEGRFPRGVVSTVEGDPGTSKSTLTATMAAHVSKGMDWPDGESCPAGSAIVANAEDPEDSVITPRLIAAGADLSKVSIIVPGDKMFVIPDDVKALEDEIRNDDVRLVVFDPMEAFLSPKVTTKDNQIIRHAFHSLEHLAKVTGCCIIIVRHLNKDTRQSSIYRGGGSIGVIATVRASTLVIVDASDKRRKIMVPHKANWSAPRPGLSYFTNEVELIAPTGEVVKTTQLEWGDEVNLDANQLLQPSTDIEADVDMTEASTWLRERLTGEEVDSAKLFREAMKLGIDRKILFRAFKLIGGTKVCVAEGEWVWKLSA